MAAPKGNQFWKIRSKHGRDKLFASPDLLWQACCEYFEWADANPYSRPEQLKKAIVTKPKRGPAKVQAVVDIPTMRPYTLESLCIYLDASASYWRNFRAAASDDFKAVITRVEEIIYANKFEGAAIGAFNANIIARDLGLVDKQELKSDNKHRHEIDYSKLSDATLDEIEKAASHRPDEGEG